MSLEGKHQVFEMEQKGEHIHYVNNTYVLNNTDGDIRTCSENSEQIDIGCQDDTLATSDVVTGSKGYQRWLLGTKDNLINIYARHKKRTLTVMGMVLALAYFCFFGYAMYYQFGDEGSWRLVGFTVFGLLLYIIVRLANIYNDQLNACWKRSRVVRHSKTSRCIAIFLRWFFRVGVFVTVIVYVIMDIVIDHPNNLITIAGLAIYIVIFYVTSINPAKVNWHTVFWGIVLQYVLALMILRTKWGYLIFKWIEDRITAFMDNSTTGILFVFDQSYTDHFFAMKVLSDIVFFITVIRILYYMGVMQTVIKVLGRFLAFCMGTTPGESINAAANVFLAMTDAPLLIGPLIKDMTRSELHAVMTAGFATIAGGVLVVYMEIGIPATHLISASIMSAPAALATSKLSYPETETTKETSENFQNIEKAPELNIIEAASNGATYSAMIVGIIAVNVIGFLSLLAFLNASLAWFGDRVGINGLTFEFICSYFLYPVSYFMGVDADDRRKVAELIGVKTFTNEFIAYGFLSDFISNRQAFENYTQFFNTTDWYWDEDNIVLSITGEVLRGGFLQAKSEVIATYALCGFGNFGVIGIVLGVLGTLAPSRKTELSKMVFRAMICGNATCCLTASVAGLLYKPL